MKSAFNSFTRLLPIWVVLVVLLGYAKPEILVPLKPHIDWLFAFTMLGIGAVLNYDDLKLIVLNPVPVFLGTLAQFVIMPLLGFLTAKIFNMPPELAIGFILVGTMPGAMASNVISYLAKTDVAYSIAITSLTTFVAPIVTPLLTYILAHAIIEVNFLSMFFSIIKMVILPLVIGFILKSLMKTTIEKYEYIFPAMSTLFIALICGLVTALNKRVLMELSLVIFIAVIVFNTAGLILGYGAGKLYRFNKKRSRTLSFEVGMQNAGLGAVLALKHFSAESALPNALFAVWCIISASVLARIWRKDPD
jgi:BASS family bile acid:Na+ symporter